MTDAGIRIPRPCASTSAWLLPPTRSLGLNPVTIPAPALRGLALRVEKNSALRAGELWPLLLLTLLDPLGVASSMRSTRPPTQKTLYSGSASVGSSESNGRWTLRMASVGCSAGVVERRWWDE